MRKTIKGLAAVLAVTALSTGTALAADKLVVKDTTGTNTVFSVDDTGLVSGKKLGMGTSTPQVPLHLNINPAFQVGTVLYDPSSGLAVTRQDGSAAGDFITADSTGTAGRRPIMRGIRSRGTLVSPLPPQLDDQVFSVLGSAWTGQRVWNAADITMKIDGTVSDDGTYGQVPIRITFSTRPPGAGATWYERMTIKSDGKIGVNATTPTALFHVGGDTIRLQTPKTPASSTATCNQGDISWDANYVYVCVASNSWKRASLAAW